MHRWYVVGTMTAMESKVKKELERRADRSDGIRQVVIPVERISEVVDGRKVITEVRTTPGYVLVNMEMTAATRNLVRRTPGVTHFLGGNTPTPLPRSDVDRMLHQQLPDDDKLDLDVAVGETISVAEGPFKDFAGEVIEVNEDAGKLKIVVPIFGQETPVEVAFDHVKLAAGRPISRSQQPSFAWQ